METVTVEGIAPAASGTASAGGADSAGALGAAAAGAASLDAAGALAEPEERRDRERRLDFGSGVGSDVAADEGEGAVVDSVPIAAALGALAAAVCGLEALAVLGAVTGAEEPAFSPGVYTGGSSSTVYSRIRWPRAQLTSTRKVTNGSGIESVERTIRTSWPSLLLPTLKVNEARNGGRSIP